MNHGKNKTIRENNLIVLSCITSDHYHRLFHPKLSGILLYPVKTNDTRLTPNQKVGQSKMEGNLIVIYDYWKFSCRVLLVNRLCKSIYYLQKLI
jgi:hypothetical protein